MIFVLISFAIRIHNFGIGNDSRIKKFVCLLKSHLLIFIPPTAYIICILPYTIANNTVNPAYPYYQCGILLSEFVIKIIMDALKDIPYPLTWLLFVYPSRVYMTEYYLNTWSGKCLAKILFFLGSYNDKEKNVIFSITSSTNNEHYNP